MVTGTSSQCHHWTREPGTAERFGKHWRVNCRRRGLRCASPGCWSHIPDDKIDATRRFHRTGPDRYHRSSAGSFAAGVTKISPLSMSCRLAGTGIERYCPRRASSMISACSHRNWVSMNHPGFAGDSISWEGWGSCRGDLGGIRRSCSSALFGTGRVHRR
jgi:hypothetical protein